MPSDARIPCLAKWFANGRQRKQDELNSELLIRLLNAVRTALTRKQKVTRVGILCEHQDSPLVDSKFQRDSIVACDYAIKEVNGLIFDPRFVSISVHKKFGWVEDTPGDVFGRGGQRTLDLVASSIGRVDLETKRAMYKREFAERMERRKREGVIRPRKGAVGKKS